MTLSHLLLALLITGYILVAIRFEERDLVTFLGDPYADYLRRVPMLIPGTAPSAARRVATGDASGH